MYPTESGDFWPVSSNILRLLLVCARRAPFWIPSFFAAAMAAVMAPGPQAFWFSVALGMILSACMVRARSIICWSLTWCAHLSPSGPVPLGIKPYPGP